MIFYMCLTMCKENNTIFTYKNQSVKNTSMTTIANLPPNFDFDDIQILKKTNQANIALAGLNGLIFSLPNFELLLLPLTIREAVASNEIENIRTTTLELLQAEIIGETANLPKAQKETLNYKNGLMKGFEEVKKNGFIATNQIVDIQSILKPSKSGVRTQMGTVIADGFGNVIHKPPQNEKEIRDLMQNLDDFMNNDLLDIDPLVKMAIGHYQFESIHPFYDGNGRTGRIIMILFLVLAKRLDYPILFLSGYLLANRQDYYRLLQEVRTMNKWKEWVIFILDGVISQSLETCQKVRKISDLKLKWKKILKENYSQLYTVEILDYLFGYAFYTQTHMESRVAISRPTIVKYMEILINQGLVKDKKVGKERLFFIPEFISILS
jgi:Fic family protein